MLCSLGGSVRWDRTTAWEKMGWDGIASWPRVVSTYITTETPLSSSIPLPPSFLLEFIIRPASFILSLSHHKSTFFLFPSSSYSFSSQLVLFPPSDLPNLYYVGRPKGTLDYKYPGTFTRNVSSVTRHSVVFGSSVNVDRPNLAAHPLYAKVSNL